MANRVSDHEAALRSRIAPRAASRSTTCPDCVTSIRRSATSARAASRTSGISDRKSSSPPSARAASDGQIVLPRSRRASRSRIAASACSRVGSIDPSVGRLRSDHMEPDRTPDGRYVVIDGRRWRASDPALPEARRKALVRPVRKPCHAHPVSVAFHRVAARSRNRRSRLASVSCMLRSIARRTSSRSKGRRHPGLGLYSMAIR